MALTEPYCLADPVNTELCACIAWHGCCKHTVLRTTCTLHVLRTGCRFVAVVASRPVSKQACGTVLKLAGVLSSNESGQPV